MFIDIEDWYQRIRTGIGRLFACAYQGGARMKRGFWRRMLSVGCIAAMLMTAPGMSVLAEESQQEEILTADMEEEESQENGSDAGFLEAAYKRIGPLLQRRCIDTQIYLQHDLTSSQLARVIGTNRYYLSQYFASQGTTYNAYINTLRINHFVEIYRDAIAHRRPFTVQQLANDSGYRSYSTFSIAFKQRMGQNVTAWMKKEEALKY